MKRTTAILQTANIMTSVLSGKCEQQTATYAIMHIAHVSDIDTDELIDSAHSLIQAEIELNKTEDANTR